MKALNTQQKYLLERLPRQYALKTGELSEPERVKKARQIIEQFEKTDAERREDIKKRYAKALNAAREAIYFQTPEKAEAEFAKYLES